jgi:hypothetical protein
MSDPLTIVIYALCEGRATVREALDWLPEELQPRLIDFLFESRATSEEILMLEDLLALEEEA